MLKIKPQKENFETTSNDPENRNGESYHNRRNPPLGVPKRNPLMGWDLNFANPCILITLFGILISIIFSAFVIFFLL